ncbi:hypothetical protein ACIBHY_29745 [Nonomuraea sp. NPDC050547]|uniref:hypothetical protein n=1 Tax=Nonomuraea sp. NPDC050547 TaxID=3364368 RepID=UPI0037B4BF13
MPGKRRTEWSSSYTHLVGANIRRQRLRQRLSVEKLATRCTSLGYPVERSNLAKLELGQRTSVAITELLIVAKALGVPPLFLLTPPSGDRVEILPGVETNLREAFAWLDGTAPLPDDEDDEGAAPRAELRLLRNHHQLVADWTARARAAATAQARADDTEQHREAWKEAARVHAGQAAHAEQLLAQLRVTMRAREIACPALPPELIHLDLRDE